LEHHLGHRGVILEPCWTTLSYLGAILGRLRAVLEPCWAILIHLRARVEAANAATFTCYPYAHTHLIGNDALADCETNRAKLDSFTGFTSVCQQQGSHYEYQVDRSQMVTSSLCGSASSCTGSSAYSGMMTAYSAAVSMSGNEIIGGFGRSGGEGTGLSQGYDLGACLSNVAKFNEWVGGQASTTTTTQDSVLLAPHELMTKAI
jgi:hypothetical protein